MQFDRLKRREFITLIGAASAAWPLATRAQQPDRIARIGYLRLSPSAQMQLFDDAFREGLRDLGYVEGRNIRIEYRSSEGDEDRLSALATELIALNVDVIVTYATGVPAARHVSSTIPIVMATYNDAVAVGLVASLAHPGGNVTGSTFFAPELMAKRLELLKEIVPSMSRAGVLLLRRDDTAATVKTVEVMEVTAKALRVELQPIEVREPGEYPNAFSAWSNWRIDALVVLDHAQFITNAAMITALATQHHFPSIGPLELPAAGGLMGYGVNFAVMFRRAAAFVDKILKGARPGEIPVEQATKFNFVINLKTAKALGLDVPPMLLARTDEVVE
jgi:putative tryptophan/tyrosine transport system substrate-binding protein